MPLGPDRFSHHGHSNWDERPATTTRRQQFVYIACVRCSPYGMSASGVR